MAEMKKYLDATALAALVDQVKAEDVKTLNAAKAHAEGLGVNYDAAGAAATAKAEAIADADGKLANKVDKVEGKDLIATSEITRLASVTNYDDTEVRGLISNVEGEIANLEAYVGEIPEDATAETVVGYVDEMGTRWAYYLGEIPETAEATTVIGYIDEKTSDITHYLGEIPETAEATTVIGYIDEKTAGIASDAALTELTERVDIIAEDYVSLDNRTQAIEDDYLKAADKTELEGKITAEQTRAEGVESGLNTRLTKVEAFFETAEGETLDTALDTLIELQNYLEGEGSTADQMLLDIAANTKAIEDEATARAEADTAINNKIGTVAEGKDVVTMISEALAEAKQYADDNDADTEYDDTELRNKVTALEAIDHDAYKAADTALHTTISAEIDADVEVVADKVTTLEGKVDVEKVSTAIATAKGEAITEAGAKATTAETNAKAHADTLNTAMDTRVKALEEHAEDYKAADTALHTTISDEIDADVQVVADDLAGYKTTNDAAVAANTAAIAANTSAINSFTPITAAEVEALFA